MEAKVELKMFFSLKECKYFINGFVKGKKVIRKQINPVTAQDSQTISYFVCIEYTE